MYNGWIPELEDEAYKSIVSYQDVCGEQLVVDFSDVKEKIYEEAKKPIDEHIDFITKKNFDNGKSSIEKVTYYLQATNDCCPQSVGRGIADYQQIGCYKGKEIKGFNSYIPWLYSQYHLRIVGKASNGGCSVSGMMDLINRYGVLPADIKGLPSYKDAIKSWSGNKKTGDAAFEKYKNEAVQYKIKTARLGRNVNDIINCCRAGYTVPFGTSVRCSLSNGYYKVGGNWMHAMEFAGSKNDDIYLTNSHGEMKPGLVKPDVLKQLINGRYFDAFVVLEIQRTRRTEPNWNLF